MKTGSRWQTCPGSNESKTRCHRRLKGCVWRAFLTTLDETGRLDDWTFLDGTPAKKGK
ncbi:hypothetical protein M1N46_00755 [Dehalococcoidia bacterium]|nr:hypothetical protein [Dehalococcoidia bacterium]